MKKFLLFSLIIVASWLIVGPAQAATSSDLIKRLSGRILLQIEEQGQAWYVHPTEGTKYYLGKPGDAFQLFRALGVGISNNDLAKIQVADVELAGGDSDADGLPDSVETALGTNKYKTDTDNDGYSDKIEIVNGYNPLGSGLVPLNIKFASANKGKIFIQVESHGEAWYVNPVDLKRYYLGRPADALTLMRKLGLGINNINLGKITVCNDLPLEKYDYNYQTEPLEPISDYFDSSQILVETDQEEYEMTVGLARVVITVANNSSQPVYFPGTCESPVKICLKNGQVLQEKNFITYSCLAEVEPLKLQPEQSYSFTANINELGEYLISFKYSLTAADTQRKVNQQESFAPIISVVDEESEGDEEPAETEDSPSSRGMLGINVLNSVTQRPIPGIVFVKPWSNITKKTDVDGYVEFPTSYWQVDPYLRNHYQKYENLTLWPHKGKDEITIYFEPEELSATDKIKGYELAFPEVDYHSSITNGSTLLKGRIIDQETGVGLSNVDIAFASSSLHGRTDQDGNFEIQLPGESNTYRLYLPGLYLKTYFQIDTFKGYSNLIEIEV